MSKKKRRFVALVTLLQRRFPEVNDPVAIILRGGVLVNGAPSMNPKAFVRSDASVRVVRPAPLRGTVKLSHALKALPCDVRGSVALDLGASSGGFTQALLDEGAVRVYAVDAGSGQLRGWLRAHPQVINLERTNLSQLDSHRVPEQIDLITMDLSYLAVSDAVDQLGRVRLSSDAHLIVLVKPTFELRAGTLAASTHQVADASLRARSAIERHGWRVVGEVISDVRGAKGAVEVFLHAQRSLKSH